MKKGSWTFHIEMEYSVMFFQSLYKFFFSPSTIPIKSFLIVIAKWSFIKLSTRILLPEHSCEELMKCQGDHLHQKIHTYIIGSTLSVHMCIYKYYMVVTGVMSPPWLLVVPKSPSRGPFRWPFSPLTYLKLGAIGGKKNSTTSKYHLKR